MASKGPRAPIPWFGGKALMVSKLLPLMPEHHIYVEPFGGAASLLLAKPRSPVEVYNDMDSGLVTLFRVLRDPHAFRRFRRLAALTPYSREEFDRLRRTWDETEDEVERAYRFYVVARMSFSGNFGRSWTHVLTASSRGMAEAAGRYLSSVEQLPEIHERLMGVQIEHGDFRRVIEHYDTPETFFYLDPPYVPATRRSGEYRHELTETDHRDLVDLLLRIEGKAMLSGYRHAVHEPLERAGWRRLDFTTSCFAAARTRLTGLRGAGAAREKQRRVESVWLNYDPPADTRKWQGGGGG